MQPIVPREYPLPIALAAAAQFTPTEIEELQAFLVWQQQKLRARRRRDHRCIECGVKRALQSPKTCERCGICAAYRRERLRKMVVSCVLMEES